MYKLEIEPSETLHTKYETAKINCNVINGKRKTIEKVDLHNLEKEVKNRGLEWKKFGDDD